MSICLSFQDLQSNAVKLDELTQEEVRSSQPDIFNYSSCQKQEALVGDKSCFLTALLNGMFY